MKNFQFSEVLSVLTHIRGGIPLARLTKSVRLADHRSAFFGPSYDFFDIQEYDPERDPPNQIIPSTGDEDIIYSRKCIEQHEVNIIFLVDLSSSLDSGRVLLKRKLLLEAIGYIGVTGARAQDPMGLIGFTDQIVLEIPARCGVNYLYYLLHQVYDFLDRRDPDKGDVRKTDFSVALDFLSRSVAKPSLVLILSDFVGFEKITELKLLASISAKHEMMCIFLDDPGELSANHGIGYMRVEDIENGKQTIVSRRKFMKLQQELRERRKEMRKKLQMLGIDSVVLEPNKQIARLQKFFLIRHKNIRA